MLAAGPGLFTGLGSQDASDEGMDKLSPERRSANMRQIRSKHTAPEMAVRRLVFQMGYRYRLHVRTLPGSPDLVFPRLRKIVLVHGCYWHPHRGCSFSHQPKSHQDYWLPKLSRNRQRDRQNIRRLTRLGWTVLVVRECEVQDRAGLAQKLSDFLKGELNRKSR